jgi:hypothetical protein
LIDSHPEKIFVSLSPSLRAAPQQQWGGVPDVEKE